MPKTGSKTKAVEDAKKESAEKASKRKTPDAKATSAVQASPKKAKSDGEKKTSPIKSQPAVDARSIKTKAQRKVVMRVKCKPGEEDDTVDGAGAGGGGGGGSGSGSSDKASNDSTVLVPVIELFTNMSRKPTTVSDLTHQFECELSGLQHHYGELLTSIRVCRHAAHPLKIATVLGLGDYAVPWLLTRPNVYFDSKHVKNEDEDCVNARVSIGAYKWYAYEDSICFWIGNTRLHISNMKTRFKWSDDCKAGYDESSHSEDTRTKSEIEYDIWADFIKQKLLNEKELKKNKVPMRDIADAGTLGESDCWDSVINGYSGRDKSEYMRLLNARIEDPKNSTDPTWAIKHEDWANWSIAKLNLDLVVAIRSLLSYISWFVEVTHHDSDLDNDDDDSDNDRDEDGNDGHVWACKDHIEMVKAWPCGIVNRFTLPRTDMDPVDTMESKFYSNTPLSDTEDDDE